MTSAHFNKFLCEYNIQIIKKCMYTLDLELAHVTFASVPVLYPTDWSVREHEQPDEMYIAFTSALLSDYLQIRQT
jgi:hypothetical protein